jgi:hypothetical protein
MNCACTRKIPHSCYECRYYLVTWDKAFPHGCRAHTFKSKKLPSLEVLEASGLECLLFVPKELRHPAQDPEAINDSVCISGSF